jgi:hypothetical protein
MKRAKLGLFGGVPTKQNTNDEITDHDICVIVCKPYSHAKAPKVPAVCLDPRRKKNPSF